MKTNNYGDQKGESLESVLGAECLHGFSDQVGSFHFTGIMCQEPEWTWRRGGGGVGEGAETLSFVSFDTEGISMFPREGNEVNIGCVYIELAILQTWGF